MSKERAVKVREALYTGVMPTDPAAYKTVVEGMGALPSDASILTEAEIEVVRSALRMMWEGMRGSSNEMWTGTDEFFDTYRRAQHILDGGTDPGPNSLLLR